MQTYAEFDVQSTIIFRNCNVLWFVVNQSQSFLPVYSQVLYEYGHMPACRSRLVVPSVHGVCRHVGSVNHCCARLPNNCKHKSRCNETFVNGQTTVSVLPSAIYLLYKCTYDLTFIIVAEFQYTNILTQDSGKLYYRRYFNAFCQRSFTMTYTVLYDLKGIQNRLVY